MPIKPENRPLYPPTWSEISITARDRANNVCEQCGIPNGSTSRKGTRVVLTVHHLNEDPRDNRPTNLIALCQACHLAKHRHTKGVSTR